MSLEKSMKLSKAEIEILIQWYRMTILFAAEKSITKEDHLLAEKLHKQIDEPVFDRLRQNLKAIEGGDLPVS